MNEQDDTTGHSEEQLDPAQQILPLGHEFEEKVPRPTLEQLELLC